MQFHETSLQGVWRISLAPLRDDRGFFARTFDMEAFAARGLQSRFVQHSISFTAQRGTLRGMHYQRAPHGEVKLITCIAGAVHDVLVDLRPDSPSYRRWQAFRLSAENRDRLYVPEGVAHGFQALQDNSEASYMISVPYAPASATGVRFNDPAFGIDWPLPVSVIAEKDLAWPDFGG